MSNSWYYVDRGNRVGPVSEADLGGLISQAKLGAEDYVWRKGFPDWKKIKDVEEVQQYLVQPAPAAVQSHTQMAVGPRPQKDQKSTGSQLVMMKNCSTY